MSAVNPAPSPAPAGSHAASLAARQLSHRYGDVRALHEVSLTVAPGRAVALVGESGSGKTTLLRCFNRMVQPTAGRVLVDDTDVRELRAVELRRRTGYVPAARWAAAALARAPQRGARPHPPRPPRRRGARRSRHWRWSDCPQIEYGDRFPHELSGGQRQRVALARALAARPGVILLDEPFGALDAISRTDLQASFADIRRELAVTTLLVTHDLAEAARLADELVVMRAGAVEQCGTLAELHDTPATPYVRQLLERALAAGAALRPIG